MDLRSLTWLSYISLVLNGFVLNALGPVMPIVIKEYGLTLAAAGTVFTSQGLGRLLSVFLSSSWSDRVGRRPVFRLGGILTFTGAGIYAVSPGWPGQIAGAAIFGAGLGMLDGVSNALISDMYAESRGLALNRLHLFFGVGSLVGPLVAAFFLGVLNSWRVLFLCVALAAAAHFFFASKQVYPEAAGGKKLGHEELKAGRARILSSPEFWLLSGIMFTYSGIGHIISGWVNTYLSGELAATVFIASLILTLYNVGIAVGRLFWGNVSERIGYPATLLVCALGGFVFGTSAVLVRQLWLVGVSFTLTGVFLAGLFPLAVACGTSLFPQLIGTVSGYLITGASLGGMLLPFLVGAVSDVVGLRFGMLAAPFFGIIQVALAVSLHRRQVKAESVEGIGA
ncbi:MAG: MFS transporter [Firmicutes bacterium]|nr:MFS transporter [Bacillota bacterium]